MFALRDGMTVRVASTVWARKVLERDPASAIQTEYSPKRAAGTTSAQATEPTGATAVRRLTAAATARAPVAATTRTPCGLSSTSSARGTPAASHVVRRVLYSMIERNAT